MMRGWKLCVGGIAGVMLFAGICCVSLRQVEELSSITGNDTSDASFMDMSSIADESPSYVGGAAGNGKGIYEGSSMSVTEELDLAECGVSEPTAGMVYLEYMRAAACRGELKNMLDWSRVPEREKEEAEHALQLFTQGIDKGKALYVNMQQEFGNGLIVRFMMMDAFSGTRQGRLYDYDHATVLTFTFFKKNNHVFVVPVSVL